MKHLNSLFELTGPEIDEIFALTAQLKEEWKNGIRTPRLQGRVVTLLFEKPSLRTRVSFEAAAMQLGAGSIFLSSKEAGLQGREALPDVARVLGGYSDAIVLRTFSQAMIEQFIQYANCPVINGLSDDLHPCQALTDLFTIQEVFSANRKRAADWKKTRLAFVGDGNNVAASLAVATAQLGMPLAICTPQGYELRPGFLTDLRNRIATADVTQTSDITQAVRDADVIYTDVWTSMGREAEADQRKRVFAPYQVNAALLSAAPAECYFMHCLPAHRGSEVTDDVLDGPQSIAFQQAENRMHLAKGLLVWLLESQSRPAAR
jgi:ornithine carbamoyltransferase